MSNMNMFSLANCIAQVQPLSNIKKLFHICTIFISNLFIYWGQSIASLLHWNNHCEPHPQSHDEDCEELKLDPLEELEHDNTICLQKTPAPAPLHNNSLAWLWYGLGHGHQCCYQAMDLQQSTMASECGSCHQYQLDKHLERNLPLSAYKVLRVIET